MSFKEIKPEELNESTFKLIGKDWMLVAAEKDGKVNAMTASWGGLGVLWAKNVAFIFVRPQRYTKEFIDASEGFTLTVFGEDKRKMLNYFGTVSGRDEDKIAKEGLTVAHEDGKPYFEEARLALVCRKLYEQPLDPKCFIDKSCDEKWYPDNDYSVMYVAEVEKVLVKE